MASPRAFCYVYRMKKHLLAPGAGMGLGIALGAAFGAAFGNVALGVAMGVVLGAVYAGAARRMRPEA